MRALFTSCSGASAAADQLPVRLAPHGGQVHDEGGTMRATIAKLLACGAVFALPAQAAQDGCPQGSYSVVVSPDHATLSILFDKFQLGGGAASDAVGTVSKLCHIAHPLMLPANMSLGVYKVDYRGFAKLAANEQASLEVRYALNPHGNEHGRVFRRKVRGTHDGDYVFSENIGAGQMKRVGCGAGAKLDITIALSLTAGGAAMTSLDTSDGAGAAMVYHLDLKKCDP
jgi:hypothetical protein